jgi:hypothetical protein
VLERPGQPDLGLGLARFVRLPAEPDVAEPAIVVVDEYQGRGLGRLLLERLAAAAAERGVRAFRALVLSANEPVLHILREKVEGATMKPEDGIVSVEVPLPVPAVEPAPPGPSGLDGVLHSLLGLAAQGWIFASWMLPPGLLDRLRLDEASMTLKARAASAAGEGITQLTGAVRGVARAVADPKSMLH